MNVFYFKLMKAYFSLNLPLFSVSFGLLKQKQTALVKTSNKLFIKIIGRFYIKHIL